MSLFAVILTKNEARHIGACIASVAWADQVLVSDSLSDDGTPDLARAAGAVVVQRPFEGWARQRNAALDSAAQLGASWVLFVDADERATPELAAEIRQVVESRAEVGWNVPRFNFIVGKQPHHGGFYPDYQLRLLRLGRARYDLSRPVHEVVMLACSLCASFDAATSPCKAIETAGWDSSSARCWLTITVSIRIGCSYARRGGTTATSRSSKQGSSP